MRHEVASFAMMDAALYWGQGKDCPDIKAYHVQLCKMRQKLPDRARPQTVWGIGLRLLPNAKARINDMINQAQEVAA